MRTYQEVKRWTRMKGIYLFKASESDDAKCNVCGKPIIGVGICSAWYQDHQPCGSEVKIECLPCNKDVVIREASEAHEWIDAAQSIKEI